MSSKAYPHDSKDEVMKKILHGKSPYQHMDRQTNYLHHLQRELDARHAKIAHIRYHKDWAEHQKNELSNRTS